jgi:alpha-tubulin suppressor-like RCC1 family protein
LIRKTPPTVTGPTDGEGGSAPGIWTLEEVAYYEKAGGWPKPILPKELYYTGAGNVGTPLNSSIAVSSPVQVGSDTNWLTITNSGDVGGAVKQDGTLWIWGDGADGRTGIGSILDLSSPVQLGAFSDWSSVHVTNAHTLAVRTGRLYSFGYNGSGRLGLNNTIDVSSPVQVGGLTTWLSVSAGYQHSAGVLENGALYTWGSSTFGCLGHNNAIEKSSPTQVGALTTWLSVTAGYFASAAIKTDGTLWTWGYNGYGLLGLNTNNVHVSSPTQVGALTNWSSVYMGTKTGYCMVAIKTDGTLWTWGRGDSGQLGNNSVADNFSSPIQIGAGTDWARASVGGPNCGAVKTDGTLWTWGSPGSGGLGHNNNINTSSPVQVGAETNWFQVAAGYQSTLMTTKG